MAETVFARLTSLLTAHGVAHQVLRHAPVFTSAEAAAVRGVALSSGAKALVCKADDRMVMFVVPADLRLASKPIRQSGFCRSLRFANGDEVKQCTGLLPGSIPPFGSLFDLPTYCDRRLLDHAAINFNAGDHAISISISPADFLTVEQPTLGDYCEQGQA